MMNSLLRKILAAGRLTRNGRLAEATLAIQRALAPHADGRAVPTPHGSAMSGAPRQATAGDVVIEIDDVRVVGDDGSEAAVARDEPAIAEPAAPDTPLDVARFFQSSYTGEAGTRTFKLFKPAGFGDTALPLIVMLHGCTQSPDDFAAGTRMNELAQEHGCLVLYPAQAPRSNAHKCWNWFSPADQRRGAGEPALIAGMTRHVTQTHQVDTDRIFVAGLSAGGAMAAILAGEYPDLFAAAGIHSGVPPGVARDVATAFSAMKSGPGSASSLRPPPAARSSARDEAVRPPREGGASPRAPVIVFHGSADATVVPANGDAMIAATLADAAAGARREVERAPEANGRSFRRTIWRAGDGDDTAPSLAEQWLVDGAPHAWSGGASAGSYTDPSGPDASREMLRFFLEHPRRQERR